MARGLSELQREILDYLRDIGASEATPKPVRMVYERFQPRTKQAVSNALSRLAAPTRGLIELVSVEQGRRNVPSVLRTYNEYEKYTDNSGDEESFDDGPQFYGDADVASKRVVRNGRSKPVPRMPRSVGGSRTS